MQPLGGSNSNGPGGAVRDRHQFGVLGLRNALLGSRLRGGMCGADLPWPPWGSLKKLLDDRLITMIVVNDLTMRVVNDC